MYTKRQVLKSAVLVPTALLLGAKSNRSVAQSAKLSISSWLPPTHPLVTGFVVPWSREIGQASDGRINIRLLPKPATNPAGHRDAVRDGVVDLAFISCSYYPGYFDLMKIPMLPFSGNSAQSNSLAAWYLYEKYLSGIKDDGYLILGVYGHGPGAVFTTREKVKKISDFHGLKIRVGGGMAADVAKVLGVNAIVKPAPESYELLSTGIADGVFFPPEAIPSFKLESIVRYATVFPGGLYSDLHAVIINKKAYENLPAADQKIIQEFSGRRIAEMAGKAWGDADTAALGLLREKGVEFLQADEQLVSDVKNLIRPFEDNLSLVAEQHGLNGAQMLADFHAEVERIESSGRG